MGLARRSHSINTCWNNLLVLIMTKTSHRCHVMALLTVVSAQIRVHVNASSSQLPDFFIFSLTDGPVVSLPVWFLNSEHEIWRWEALSLQLLQPSLGPMRPLQALRNCCVGTWQLLHWSLAESCYPAEWLWHVRGTWGLEVLCACHGLAS